MSQDEFAAKAREKAIEASLEDDVRLLEHLFDEIRTAKQKGNLEPLLFDKDKHAYNSEKALGWWNSTKAKLPHSLTFLEQVIQNGEQPIFCNVSLYVLSEAPTLYVPVPYLRAKESFDGFKKTIWLNAPDSWDLNYSKWEYASRTFSHAIANISYSVRVGDRPVLGWLAKAHVENLTIYIPDVAEAKNIESGKEGAVYSVATNEERFLGMASVLYIPLICIPRLPPYSAEGANHAQAVLMLWSPIPHRWDSLFPPNGNSTVLVFDSKIAKGFGHDLRYLGDNLAKDKSNQFRHEMKLLAFIHGMSLWVSHASSGFQAEFKQLMHGTDVLLEYLCGGRNIEKVSVRECLHYVLWKLDGLVCGLARKWGKSLHSVTLCVRGSHLNYTCETTLGEMHKALDLIPPEAVFPFNKTIATRIACEPESNICKYAQDLTRIDVLFSQRYVTLRYTEKLTSSAVERLIKDDTGFRRYLAVRRGLAVPSLDNPDGANYDYGIGLMLFSAVATKARVFRHLYLSPGGEDSWVEVAIPYEFGPIISDRKQ